MKHIPSALCYLFISILLSSCEFHCSVGESKDSTKSEKYKPEQEEGMLLYNGIKLKTNNVVVNKAYLVNRDSTGEMIDEDNFIDIRKGVKLIVIVDSGWTKTENGVSLGGSMKAVTEDGETILDMPDIFKGVKYISPQDAKVLGLSLYFTSTATRKPVTINVAFKVWDNNSSAYVEGTYTVHTK